MKLGETLVFLRRTQKEIEVFGGDVYIDINGRNIGILGTTDYTYDVAPGNYKIKMYKSHTYDSFIGHADAEISISDGEKLLVKYSPPMIINQPGNIVISNFESYSQTQNLAIEKENKITIDDSLEKQKKIDQEQKSQNTVIMFMVIMIISAIIYVVSMANIYNY